MTNRNPYAYKSNRPQEEDLPNVITPALATSSSTSSLPMTTTKRSRKPWLFQAMTTCHYPFLVTLPFFFTLLICLGFSRPSIIEEDVSNLWIPTDGTYWQNKQYANSVGAMGRDEISTFAAMALGRNGENLFKEENLNAIIERMQLIESTPVTYMGNNFTWDDVCFANGLSTETTYQMPCLRLSPMDLFEEARWYFTEEQRVTWYKEIRTSVVKPLVVRYGILKDMCISQSGNLNSNSNSNNAACDHVYKLRTDVDYAIENGYPASHAGKTTDLLMDVFSLELSDPCKMCVEDGIDERLQQLQVEYVIPAFTTLTQQLRRFLFTLEEREDVRMETLKYVEALIKRTATIATTVTRADVEDFYMYYTLRNLYGDGNAKYQEMYREINDPMYRSFICKVEEIICPPEDVTLEEARETLLRHTDNEFSSIVTSGAPFPFWSAPDGTGALFGGSYQVGGSGINMSAPLNSLAAYLDLEHRENIDDWEPFFYDSRKEDGFVDPLGGDYLWETMVATNPIYAWFMAGESEMTAHCGNGDLRGTNSSDITIDLLTAKLVKEYSPHLCTSYNTPFEEDWTKTKQHFARMWYDLLIDSPFVLDIIQGESDPYSWTSGAGCGYKLGYSRFSFTNQSEGSILYNSSTELYNIDEGVEIGVVDRSALIGDAYPPVGEYSLDNPLEHVGLLQSIYATLGAAEVVERVKHQNRPAGPVHITEADAREILTQFKIMFEELWSIGWDSDEFEVQFVGYFDDFGVPGTIGRVLQEVTMSSGLLTAVSILVIAAFSVALLFSRNPVESRVGITLLGVTLVMLAFFASVALGILIGIKINLTIAWTLPFIIIGLGVDNIYICLLSLQKQRDYSDKSFFRGMKEVVIPITMTSLVNVSMFAIMQINNIPVVYLTAQVAVISLILLYLAVVFCFPAYCHLDMKRQNEGRRDIFVWSKCENAERKDDHHFLERLLYNRFYHPLILGEPRLRVIIHSLIWACAALFLGLGLFGISRSTIGLGLSDFLPSDHQGHIWAESQSQILGSWAVSMNWPAIDYSSPDVQMMMIKQFENVVDTLYIVEVDTRRLWIAEMALWTTRQCDYNSKLDDGSCGRDMIYNSESTCSGTWKRNTYGLRERNFPDSEDICQPYDGGVCRNTTHMHPYDLIDLGIDPTNISNAQKGEMWCPVFEGWSEDKMRFCVSKWSEIVGGSGGLVLDSNIKCEGEVCDAYSVKVPIPYSSGPTMTATSIVSHELTLEMMQQTRAVCDDDPTLDCWMSGAPFDYWSQYEGIQMSLVEISGASIMIGFGVSWIFLAGKLLSDGKHGSVKVAFGSFVGALLIAATCFFCLVAVVGMSLLSGVSLTAFSVMSFALSVGFAVEYSVHIVARWLRCNQDTALERVEHTMSFLFLPTFMSFVSSTLGVICLSFTGFEFNTRFFFRPLIIVMFITYFFGCYWLPVFLTWFEFDFVKLGPGEDTDQSEKMSPLAKVQDSESSEIGNTSSDDMNSKSADLENSTGAPSMADCVKTAVSESGGGFDFFPCMAMAMANCGASSDQDEHDYPSPTEPDENSLIVHQRQANPDEQVNTDEPANTDDQVSLDQQVNPDEPANPDEQANLDQQGNPGDQVSLEQQANPDEEAESGSYSTEAESLASSLSARRSAHSSVDSSQRTIPVDNTREAFLHKNGTSPRVSLYWKKKMGTEGGPTQRVIRESLVDSVSNESLDIERKGAILTDEYVGLLAEGDIALSTESSGVFDGVDGVTVQQYDDLQNKAGDAPQKPKQNPVDPLSQPREPPGRLVTSPFAVQEVPRSMGGILLSHDNSFEFSNGDYPPIRKSLSSPQKKNIPTTNPLIGLKSNAGSKSCLSLSTLADSSVDSQNYVSKTALLEEEERFGSSFKGYDMGSVVQDSVPTFVAADEAQSRLNREIVREENGDRDVLSVHAVGLPDETTIKNDTVNF